MSELTPRQKAKLHEVADLMLSIYNTLVDMQYLDKSWIDHGPHDITALLPLYNSLNLSPSIIYLYSILPYIDSGSGHAPDFFQGGSFADFRIAGDVGSGRDPFYELDNGGDDEHSRGGGMRPWMTSLSVLGNHRSVIIYDAKTHRVGIFDQESVGSTDHGVNDSFEESEEEEEDDVEGKGDKDEEEKEEEGKPLAQGQNYDDMAGRPARDVLRDIVKWYKELIETPGGGDQSCIEWDQELIKPLYRKHGWPSADFDGEAFLIDKTRVLAANSAAYNAEEPVRRVQCLQGWLNTKDRVKCLRKKEESAQTEDEKWLAKWELWRMEERSKHTRVELEKAIKVLETECPGGITQRAEELPLYELRELREEYKNEQTNLESVRETGKDMEAGRREKKANYERQVRYAEKQVLILEKAIEASERDAARLCPGMSLPVRAIPDILPGDLIVKGRIERQEGVLASFQKECQSFREYMVQVPVGAVEARQDIQRHIDEREGTMRKYREGIARDRDILARMLEDA